MKARIQPQETVLLYHIDSKTERGKQIYGLLAEMGISVIEISESMLSQTLGFCAGISGYPQEDLPLPKEPFGQEVLVMRGFSRQRMDELMKAFGRRKIPSVELKAIVTDFNCGWACQKLFEELFKEHRFMTAYMKLRKLIRQAEELPCERSEFQRALEFSKEQVARGNDAALETLLQAYDGLKAQMEESIDLP